MVSCSGHLPRISSLETSGDTGVYGDLGSRDSQFTALISPPAVDEWYFLGSGIELLQLLLLEEVLVVLHVLTTVFNLNGYIFVMGRFVMG
jgi:hypothetical protein